MTKRPKTGGRRKGTPNKITSELKCAISKILRNELQGMPKLVQELEPKARLEVIIKLLPYVIPKIEAMKPGYFDPDHGTPDYSHLTTEELVQLAHLNKKIVL